MTRTMRGCLWATLASASFGAQAQTPCQHGLETQRSGNVARSAGVRVASIAPANGSAVQSTTLIAAEIDYDVSSFRPGTYQLTATFLNADRKTTTPAGAELPLLQFAHGRMQACIPVAPALNVEALVWPLELEFHLGRRMSGGAFIAMAKSPVTNYAQPEVAAAKPANTPPVQLGNLKRPELLRAISDVWEFTTQSSAHMRACLNTNEQVRPKLSMPVVRWHETNQKFIDDVYALYAGMLIDNGIPPEELRELFNEREQKLMTKLKSDGKSLRPEACEGLVAKLATREFDADNKLPRQSGIVKAFLTAHPIKRGPAPAGK
jgi:hypothetical protein